MIDLTRFQTLLNATQHSAAGSGWFHSDLDAFLVVTVLAGWLVSMLNRGLNNGVEVDEEQRAMNEAFAP